MMNRARALFFAVFYRLPGRWRHRLARLGSAKYILGAVVLVRAADPEGPERLLLVRQPPGRAWSLPAGLLKRREPAREAAARELLEETGIRVDLDALIPGTPSAVVHHYGGWVDVVFETRVPGEVPLVPDGAEIIEVAWHPVDELPPLTTPAARLLAHYDLGPLVERTR
jgi:8-oxo-dGTP pyrophosphatase MutT (NUDIX family)